ncbi:DUF3261 domain-containing protein [Vibrio mangrovi]|uniref:DUF3261 domain-containing protein n=1 Tax=Vibrio mangrovi TaxID=474394 RepID=A0A1Y6IR55_9VIBR|nr:DUF3261 domain-containing protein [Vibrio mangrovi]MDW6001856.1 DUF3261 domain-containing protein [Vibrio mangrovi]SMS00117.1 hypothetical protein VIM7927_01358 [Vibrio mangrovi]
MKTISLIPSILIFFILFSLNGCSSLSRDAAGQVEISPGITVRLPLPESLGSQLTASQLIQANWTTKQGEKQSNQLPVRLQVSPGQIAVAGFSSWGTRLTSLKYQVDDAGKVEIQTQTLPGLQGQLPDPKQILLNLMLTLWPQEAWEKSLQPIHWHMIDHDKQRIITDNQGNKIIIINYDQPQPLDGNIQFTNLKIGYEIRIKTVQYQIQGRNGSKQQSSNGKD